jgi:TRAP-type C4-dicarboxylate transport system substrate-binding protein
MEESNKFNELSRREFLRDACVVAGGIALGATGLLSSCGGNGNNTGASTSAGTTAATGKVDAAAAADPRITYKVTHQFAVDDSRDKMMKALGNLITQRTGGSVGFLYYPNQTLFKAQDTWDALRTGACDAAILPLEYASGKVPELGITLMPCLVQSIKQGVSWKDKPIGQKVDQIMQSYGVRHVLWAWCDGGPGSKKHQIIKASDVNGDKIRAAGRTVEYMFEQAGASINSMTSAEIYAALATGVIDDCLTSSASYISFKLYEQVKYINVPRDYCMSFQEEGWLMNEKRYQKMTANQRRVFDECAKEIQDNYVVQNLSKDTAQLIELFSKAGVQMYYETKEDQAAWTDFAKKTSWKNFADTVPNGQSLIDMAVAALQ